MKIVLKRLLWIVVFTNIFNVATPAFAFTIVFGERDTGIRTDFNNSFDLNTTSTVIDDGINFGAAPATGSVAQVERNGNINTESFSYKIYDIDFSDAPTGSISPGNIGNDIDDLDNITVETPASQDGATGNYDWGVDGASGNGTSNAALFDFTGNSIGHFGVDLHDFEAGAGISASNNTSGASGEIRIYQSGSLVHSHTLEFPGVEGGGSTDNPNNTEDNDSTYQGYGNKQSMFVGVSANDESEFFDQIVFVLGDDDVGTVGIASEINDGSTERWAADGFTFGRAYRTVPFEFSPTLGIFLVGGFWILKRVKIKLS